MNSNTEPLPPRSELSAVVIENGRGADVCILYPQDASDEQLDSMWILAEGETYTSVDDIR
jgi:hypothetical protein